MGYMRHHAIVCTGHSHEIDEARNKAISLFGLQGVSNLSSETVNGYQSFCVWPDGSKEGWDESLAGDAKRAVFTSWLSNEHIYKDTDPKECKTSWVEVQFGDENSFSYVTRDSDSGLREDKGVYTSDDARKYKERCEELEERLNHESRLRRRAEESRRG